MEGRLIWMFAQQASVMCNLQISEAINRTSAQDFVPVWRTGKDTDDDEAEEREIEMLNARFDAFNAKVTKYLGSGA